MLRSLFEPISGNTDSLEKHMHSATTDSISQMLLSATTNELEELTRQFFN